ncbi:PLP-dependent transferase [Jaminaea rosea]|uniref:PLP-dependent transferase n=1 Tax=Jaminaea rosea TaxID=1569628 RepID=A0A316V077_9BASI|nr:PLP-dependent transferase [Jaminaea rosea]PWN30957.1 PLP-dependent transferase [Jaminaea rosea]
MDVPSQEELQDQLERLQRLALERHKEALTLPTIASPSALTRGLTELNSSLPATGLGLNATTSHLLQEVAPTLAPGHAASRYFGFVTGGVTPSAQIADWFTTLLDANVQVHLPNETLSTLIEHDTMGMLCELLGLERQDWTGTFSTGATASNVLGLACGRERTLATAMRERGLEEWSSAEHGAGYDSEDEGPYAPPTHVYVAQPHASVKKAAALVGIGRARVVDVGQRVPPGKDLNDPIALAAVALDFDLALLESHLARNKQRKHPSIIVAGLGEVNTGALTAQLPALRRLCDKYGAWLHVDAAFSAFVCLLDGHQWISRHLDECADSITSDAHKQLNVPYDCGLFFVRRRGKERGCGLVAKASGSEEQSVLEDVLGPGRGGGPAYLAAPSASSGALAEDSDTASFSLLAERRAYLASLPSPLHRNIENSRRFRALPVYTTLLCYGREGITKMVRRNVDFARAIEAWMRGSEGREWYEVLTPECGQMDKGKMHEPQPWRGEWATTVVLFRGRAVEAAELIARIKATRMLYVSPTSWGGKGAVRLAVSNWRTGLEDGDGKHVAKVQQSYDYQVTVQTLLDIVRGDALAQ